MKKKSNKLSAEKSRLLTKLLTITKTANMSAVMEPSELAKVIALVATDIGKADEMAKNFPDIWDEISPTAEYFSLKVDWFSEPVPHISAFDVVNLLDAGGGMDDDFMTYLKCLTELHKRRRKYGLILERQPLPTMVQVSPRALMEYGSDFPPEALASWLTWRKFFYDLDNRSAQETGYLFEPILAAAIGGEPKSAKDKVVVRTGDSSKGRQVDCWKVLPDSIPLAYEFKLRVTIAASGQGRFSEELSFAVDCQNSGVKPVLVVLDPTENEKLTYLQNAYRKVGGFAYIGDDAWMHLEQEAGPTMAAFIEKYVRHPVDSVSAFEREIKGDSSRRELMLLALQAKIEDQNLRIVVGDYVRNIPRQEDSSFEVGESDDE